MNKRKTFSKFIAIALTVLMFAGLLPMMALAADTANTRSLYFSSSDGYFRYDGADGERYDMQPDNWSWDAESNTLTLNNFSWMTDARDAVILTDSAIIIEVEGINTITSTATDPRGILGADGTTIVITGSGVLNINALSSAIEPRYGWGVLCDDQSFLVCGGAEVNIYSDGYAVSYPVLVEGTMTLAGRTNAIYHGFRVDESADYILWTNATREDPGGLGTLYSHGESPTILANVRYIKATTINTACIHAEDGGTITTAATCESEGVMTFKCELCGEILRTEPIPALGHSYAGAVTRYATCAEKGEMTYTCSVCGDSYTAPIEKDPDNHVGGTYEAIITPATFSTEGAMGIYCAGCDELLDTRVIPILLCDHDYVSAVTAPATCAEKGVMTYICSICGDSYTAPIEKDPDNHVGGTYEGIITPATLEADGEMGIYCAGCDELLNTRVIPKLPGTPEKTDVEFLQEKAADIIKNGLTTDQLRLDGKILALMIDGREFELSTNANNRNINGEIAIGDGYYLIFDLKGNGSNIKDFRIVKR